MYLFRVTVIKTLEPHRGQGLPTRWAVQPREGRHRPGARVRHCTQGTQQMVTKQNSVDGTTVTFTAHLQYHSTEEAQAEDTCGPRVTSTVVSQHRCIRWYNYNTRLLVVHYARTHTNDWLYRNAYITRLVAKCITPYPMRGRNLRFGSKPACIYSRGAPSLPRGLR